MLNAKAFANAASVVMTVFYIGCVVLSYFSSDLLFTLAQSWIHTLNLEAARITFSPNIGTMLLGLVTAVGLTWVTTYGTIILYNRWEK
ncbi:MAG: DUF5676 family membrane protein [Candidatus Daviesbacteria bacterium]|nr:DUF5676 family membrane protein [Candidatus Daviesbacteria bacterium]